MPASKSWQENLPATSTQLLVIHSSLVLHSPSIAIRSPVGSQTPAVQTSLESHLISAP